MFFSLLVIDVLAILICWYCYSAQRRYEEDSTAHTLCMIGGILCGLGTCVALLVTAGIIALGSAFGGLRMISDETYFTWHRSEFEHAAENIRTKKAHLIEHSSSIYFSSSELSKLGINGIIDEGRGVICFSYGLESFDGPTRVLIYDPQHSVHSDYSRWTKGEMPSLTRWTIDDWTYIKNND